MNILLLRGRSPLDRDPKETHYKSISECDDIYTLMMHEMCFNYHCEGRIWYWGENRMARYNTDLIEYRFNTFQDTLPEDYLFWDVVWARGGFSEYDYVLERIRKCNPKAFIIYYGANAKRFYPKSKFKDYNLILVDSSSQYKETCKRFPKIPCRLFIKPAPEDVMYPMSVKKEYDVCYVANWNQKQFKGQELVFKTAPKDIKILHLGTKCKLRYPSNIINKRVLRTQMALEYNKCKCGIIPYNKGLDSCPRVLPEMIACDIPVICTNTFYFWKTAYIHNSQLINPTGELCHPDDLWRTVRKVLGNLSHYRPRLYYNSNLSIEKASKYLMDIIMELLKK